MPVITLILSSFDLFVVVYAHTQSILGALVQYTRSILGALIQYTRSILGAQESNAEETNEANGDAVRVTSALTPSSSPSL